jgi:DNA mismatch repair protein MutS2
VAATTHYEGLKALALHDPRFVNASVGFDLATMTPTFELVMGVPGRSSALAVARRFGLPSTVLERAERFLTREDQSFEALVERLHDERGALELARRAAEQEAAESAALRVRLTAELELAKAREKRVLSEEGAELLDRLRRARDELREARARLRAKKADASTVREAELAIERVAGQVALGGRLESLVSAPAGQGESPFVGEVRKGTRVWVPRLRAEADVVDVLADGSVRVAAGPLKLTVARGDLRAPAAREPASPPPAPRAAVRAPLPEEAPIPTSDNTCDLRGLRVDDGVGMAMTFLDRAVGSAQSAVFLVHGHGTGALREAVREELSRSRYVARFRAAPADQGGEGVTVVWLA